MEQDLKTNGTTCENDSHGKVPFISKIAYGMGDVGCNFSWMFVGNFLMIFYTDVFGISMSAVATIRLSARSPTRRTPDGDDSALGYSSVLLSQPSYLYSPSGRIRNGARPPRSSIWLSPTASSSWDILASTCLMVHSAEP